jgi:hypothetical protein
MINPAKLHSVSSMHPLNTIKALKIEPDAFQIKCPIIKKQGITTQQAQKLKTPAFARAFS